MSKWIAPISRVKMLIINADAQDIPLKDASVDAIVTDPPYHLTTGKRGGTGAASLNVNSPAGRARISTGFMGKAWDGGNVAFRVETWIEALRVCKPGAYLLAFGGTRTFHRLTCAIEDAGFEIRDCILWLYGSGFPKSLDVSKAIDKAAGAGRPILGFNDNARPNRVGKATKLENIQTIGGAITEPQTDAAKEWQGWGTALKPAWEPIMVARKPLEGTVAENVQRWGTGAMNIDACRIAGQPWTFGTQADLRGGGYGSQRPSNGFVHARNVVGGEKGRWPANVILDDESAALLDEQSGELTSGNNPAKRSADKHPNVYAGWKGEQCLVHRSTDTGGASRFFYTAKADRKDRGEGNDHPTVKPQDLMAYLLKLVTRPRSVVLDNFAGSGTTLLVADKLGRRAIGLDNEFKHTTLTRERIIKDAPLLRASIQVL